MTKDVFTYENLYDDNVAFSYYGRAGLHSKPFKITKENLEKMIELIRKNNPKIGRRVNIYLDYFFSKGVDETTCGNIEYCLMYEMQYQNHICYCSTFDPYWELSDEEYDELERMMKKYYFEDMN